MPFRPASTISISPSTAPPFPRERSIRSCSAMKRAPLPVLSRLARGISRRPTEVRFSSTRWPSCRFRRRRVCCASCRRASFCASGRRKSRRPTCAWSLQRMSTFRRRSFRGVSAKTSIIVSVPCPSSCLRCASGPRTSRCCSASSLPTSPRSTACPPSRSTTVPGSC